MPEYAGVLCAFSTLMVATRLFLRASNQAGKAGVDDILLVVAWLASVMFTTVIILAAVRYDVGRHIWDIPIEEYTKIAETIWLGEFAFLVCGGCTKISVLLFYRRLVKGTFESRWKWAVIIAIVFTTAYTLAFMLALVFNCNPTEAYWKAFDPTWGHDYTCVDTTVINLLAGVCAAFSDLYSVVLPFLMVRLPLVDGPHYH